MQRIRLFISNLGILLLCGLFWQCSDQSNEATKSTESEESAWEETIVDDPYLEEILQEIEGGDKQNIDKKDEKGNAPIHLTVKLSNANQRKRALTLLLQGKADVNAEDTKGNTALNLVMNQDIGPDPNANPEHNPIKMLVQRLVEAGAEVNKANKKKEAPIHLAVKKSQSENKRAAYRYREIVELLLVHNADLNLGNKKGRTAFMMALKRCSDEDYFEFFKKMAASSKIDWKQKDEEGRGLLHFASDISHTETREKCLEHIVDRIRASLPARSMSETEFKVVFLQTKHALFLTLPSVELREDKLYDLICGSGHFIELEKSLAFHLVGAKVDPYAD